MRALREVPEILAEIAAWKGAELALQTQLRQRYADDVVRAALALGDARRRAAGKFARSDRMWLDRQGAEQATPEAVARHKAQRFRGDVADLCCGVGGDAVALAATCRSVLAVDVSPAQCLRTLWNAEVYEVAERLRVRAADVQELTELPDYVHIDPDRRAGGGRALRVEDYVPGLGFLQVLRGRVRGGAIKVGPASNFGGKFRDVEIELVSLHGECKEATIWFGELAGAAPYRATALPSGETLAGHPLDVTAPQSELGAFVFDPDPAVVRAGLVDQLAVTLGLRRLDAAEEYLTGDEVVTSPFVQSFAVERTLPNNDRQVRQAVRAGGYGVLEIKCRHLPIDADAVRKRLPLEGQRSGVLFYLRCAGKARAVLAERRPGA